MGVSPRIGVLRLALALASHHGRSIFIDSLSRTLSNPVTCIMSYHVVHEQLIALSLTEVVDLLADLLLMRV